MTIESWIYANMEESKPSSTGNDVLVNCPFCRTRAGKRGASHHLSISLTKQVCHCYRCGYRGTWAQLVMDVDGCSYGEAIQSMGGDAITPLYKLLPQIRYKDDSYVATELLDMPNWFMTIDQAVACGSMFDATLANAAYGYIRKRLMMYRDDWDVYMRRWGIQSNPRGYGKLVIPIERGWWQSRLVWHKQYMSMESPIGDRLYNYAALDMYKTVAICEGAISAACYGEDAIALCGKVANTQQLLRLAKAQPEHYVVCIEVGTGDDMRDLATQLRRYRKQVTLKLYDGDPASTQEYQEVPYNSWADQVRDICRF